VNPPEDLEVPEGREWLLRLQTRILGPCCVATDDFLLRNPQTLEVLDRFGTVMSLLDRLSSCFWRCHKGDHTAEYLVGRACGSASAAWILARHGHYDASLSIVREIGEVANAVYLFGCDTAAFDAWKKADDAGRMRDFSPVKIRLALEGLGFATPMGKDMYKALSERAAHVTPKTRPELYSAKDHPLASGTFQDGGIGTCISHLAYSVGLTAMVAVKLIQTTSAKAERIVHAAESLLGAVRAST
jgi:hypothetical protein